MFTLPWLEMSRFTHSTLSKAAIVAILIVPTLYAGLYLTANWAPTENLDRLDAAVVNLDTGADAPSPTGEADDAESAQDAQEGGTGEDADRLEVGDELTRTLTEDGDAGFTWVESDVDDAASGLASGTYAATLTIPSDFSERIASSGGDDPEKAGLTLQTNDAYSFIVGQVANTILQQLNTNLNSDITAEYLDQVYIGFNDIHENIAEAADGASELHDGAVELEDGAGRLSDGAGELASGTRDLKDGTEQARDGSRELADGAGALVDGLDQAHDASGQLSDGASAVADGTGQLADGADSIVSRVDDVADRAEEILDHATSGLDRARDDLDEASDARDEMAQDIDDLAERYPDDPAVQRLAERADEFGDDLDHAGDRAGSAVDEADDLADDLGSSIDEAVDTAHGVRDSVHDLDDGATRVADGAGQLEDGLADLVDGGGQLEDGADRLADGAVQLDDGAQRLVDGAGELDDGLIQLHDGSVQLRDGLGELADGLASGVEQIPTYDNEDRDVRSDVVSLPVDGDLDKINEVSHYGEGLAPFFLSLALWIGGMITYMVINAIPPRSLATPASSRRVAWSGFVPGAVLGVGQVLLLFGVIAALLGFDAAKWPSTIAYGILIAGVFAAIHQVCVVWLGGVGRLVALVLLMIQLATAGGTYPVATAPEFLQWISPFMPMTHAVAGLRMLISGGTTGMLAVHLGALLLTGALAMGATIIGCRRKRMYTVARLHPSLQLA